MILQQPFSRIPVFIFLYLCSSMFPMNVQSKNESFSTNLQNVSFDIQREQDYYQTDSMVGHTHRPNAKRTYSWPEHESGRIIMRTNNLGFREDKDTLVVKSKGVSRILVVGDSHTDGVVYNNESFPNLLEDLLNTDMSRKKFEVLNGGTGYYGPHNYFLFLKKYLFLKPDIFIITLYMGNDFLDALRHIGEFNTNTTTYENSLVRASSINPPAVSQGLNQVYFLKTHPDEIEKALQVVEGVIVNMVKLCEANHIMFICVILPTKLDVEWDSDKEGFRDIKSALNLTDDDLLFNGYLRSKLIFWFDQVNIMYVDIADTMKSSSGPFFWSTDHHLNKRGHQLVAHKIFEFFLNEFEKTPLVHTQK